ncbi:MAG: hypothetical protein ACRCST_08555 [Turicibacter sp.]
MFLKSKKLFFVVAFFIFICLLGYKAYEKQQRILEIFEAPYSSEVRAIFTQEFKEQNYPVTESTFWDTDLNGVTPKQVVKKKAKQLYKRYQLLQKQVAIIIPLDSSESKITPSDSWSNIKKRMETWSQIVESNLINSATEAEIKAYYDSNSIRFKKQDIIEGNLSFWQNGAEVLSENLLITEENIKVLTEEYDELTEILSDIQSGSGASWEDPDGIYYFVCQKRTDGGIESFDDVIGAVAAQYAQEKLEQLLNPTQG